MTRHSEPIVSAVFATAEAAPHRTALVAGGQAVSYSMLRARIQSAAAFLESHGVHAGDRVVLSASNANASFVYGYLGCRLLGAIAVPVDTKIGEKTLSSVIKQTEPKLVFPGDPDYYRLPGLLPLTLLENSEPASLEPRTVDLDETADILCTAGTTNVPKGVMQSHRNILAFCRARNAAVEFSPEDRIVIPVPLSHGFGLGRLRASLLGGGSCVLVYGFLFPAQLFSAFDDGATALCCVPSGFAALFQLTGDTLGEYASRLKYVETATAPLPEPIRRKLLELLPDSRIYNSYGSTETSSSIAFSELHGLKAKLDSVGRPVSGVELRIVDPDTRSDAATGKLGHVLVRGEQVMRGYWREPVKTAQVLSDGWLSMNDVGFLDAEGYLYLSGRKEDLINVGGLKVAPLEIETALREHPAIEDCACVGIDDPAGLSGEVAKAYLTLSPHADAPPSDEELVEFLRSRLETFKIPAVFEWIETLPKNPLGKLQRAKLREL